MRLEEEANINQDEASMKKCHDYQNNLYEVILTNSPFLAEEMFKRNKLRAFNRNRIAKLCEVAGLKHRAMLLYETEEEIK